jgi:NADH-quinone oxidoreductase subunit D
MSDMESMIHHFKLITEGIPAPEGDCYYAVEGSKGELGMYVVAEEGARSRCAGGSGRPPS